MRKICFLVAITVLLPILALNPGEAEQETVGEENLMQNPGFEEEDHLVGWKSRGKPFEGILQVVGLPDIEPHSGENCLSVTTEKGEHETYNYHRTIVGNTVRIPAKSGSCFKFTFWAKGELKSTKDKDGRLEKGRLGAIFYSHDEKDMKWLGGQWSRSFKPSPEKWQRCSGEVIVYPEKKKVDRVIVIFCIDVIGEGTVYLDDIEVSSKK